MGILENLPEGIQERRDGVGGENWMDFWMQKERRITVPETAAMAVATARAIPCEFIVDDIIE